MKRPTILQIVPELDTGGAELSAVEVAGAIVRGGGRALVLSEGGRLVERLTKAGGEFVPFAAASKNPARMLWNVRSIERLIRKEGVDLVHARSRAPAWSAMLAARRAGVPFVTTVHGAHREKGRAKKLYNSIMARGDRVIVNSKFTGATVRQRYDVPDERMRVIYRGIDPGLLDPDVIDAARVAMLRQTWALDPDTRVILLAARLSPIKGHSTVIEAVKLLKARGQFANATVVFAGDAQGRDGYVAQLEQEIAAAGLGDAVRLVGHVNDIPAALKAAHVALLTSIVPETFGRTVAEAAAMRCPMIASNLGAPPELMLTCDELSGGAITGWLVPPGDAPALADALQLALDLSPADRVQIGDDARDYVVARFSLDQMRQQTLAVYDELLHSGLGAAYAATVGAALGKDPL